MTPSNWIGDLSNALGDVQCRVGDDVVGFDAASHIIEHIFAALRSSDHALWWAGNGGSAAVCAHLAQDALNKLGLRSQSLNDPALLTCMANDFGYEQVYSRPFETLLRPGDALILISSSGRSRNLLNCADLAAERGVKLITLSAFAADNPLWRRPADVAFFLPCALYGHAEVGHEALLHAVIEVAWLKAQSKQAAE